MPRSGFLLTVLALTGNGFALGQYRQGGTRRKKTQVYWSWQVTAGVQPADYSFWRLCSLGQTFGDYMGTFIPGQISLKRV